jgi:hypothetical protein
MMQASEILSLLFDIIVVVFIIVLYRTGVIPRYTYFFIGYGCVLLSNVFTVAEGFVFPDFLNVLEHLSYFVSGIFFFLGFVQYFRLGGDEQL